jgi:hypothetical protein
MWHDPIMRNAYICVPWLVVWILAVGAGTVLAGCDGGNLMTTGPGRDGGASVSPDGAVRDDDASVVDDGSTREPRHDGSRPSPDGSTMDGGPGPSLTDAGRYTPPDLFADGGFTADCDDPEFPANTWVPLDLQFEARAGELPESPHQDENWQSHRYGGLTYRPDTGEIVVLDGAGYSNGIYANAVFGLDASTGRYRLYDVPHWRDNIPLPENLTDPGPAPRHTYGAWTYAPETQSVYLWSGANRRVTSGSRSEFLTAVESYVHPSLVSETGEIILGFWRYDFRDHQWHRLPFPDDAAHGVELEMAYVPSQQRIYLFKSLRAFHEPNVWSFDVVSETWTRESLETSYDAFPASFYDTRRERIVFMMMEDFWEGRQDFVHDLGAFDPETKTFTELPVEGERPQGLEPGNDGMTYHPGYDIYFAWSGDASSTGSWIYDPKTHRWSRFLADVPVPPVDGVQHWKLEYDWEHDLLVLCRQTTPQYYALRLCP